MVTAKLEIDSSIQMPTLDSSELTTIAELKALGSTELRDFKAITLLKRATPRTAKNGNAFLVVECSDKSGSMTFNCFSDSSFFEKIKATPEGSVLYIEGRTDYYLEKLSPKVLLVEVLDDPTVDSQGLMSRLIESSPEDPIQLWEELMTFVAAIKHPRLRATVELVMEDIGEAFKATAGAIAMHHAYRHGLMEHTVHMARAAKALMPLYPEVHPDLTMAGIILHDIGKTLEYTQGRVTKKSQIGILQGHVVLGYRLTRSAGMRSKLEPELLERLEHIILSHQGELEWGAATLAATPEAVFVSMVDNLDAKMGMVQQALRVTPKSENFSERIPGLQTSLLVSELNDESE